MSDETRSEQRAPAPPRKPYETPTLVVYGDLAELTRAKGRSGVHSDGAFAQNNKTI